MYFKSKKVFTYISLFTLIDFLSSLFPIQDGSITCHSKAISCQKPNCLDPVMDPDTCCPMCESRPCEYAGRQYNDGAVVPSSRDPCETCRCTQGFIDCQRETCKPVTCRHPGRDQCCDTCDCKFVLL